MNWLKKLSNHWGRHELQRLLQECHNHHGRVVKMETLEDTFIPEVFKEKTWTKLLNSSGNVCAKLIREFFANALWKEIASIVGWGKKSSLSRGNRSKKYWKFVHHLNEFLSNTKIEWILLSQWRKSLAVLLKRRHWTQFPSLRKWDFGLYHAFQTLPGDKLNHLVQTKDPFSVWSLHM